MTDNLSEMNLTIKFSEFEPEIIKHILKVVCGDNEELAEETLNTFREDMASYEVFKKSIIGKKKLSTQNIEDISSFMAIAEVEEEIAYKFLENNAWKLEDAVNMYYESGIPESFKINTEPKKESIKNLYNKLSKLDKEDFKTPGIHINGLNILSQELGLDSYLNYKLILIGWVIGAKKESLTFTEEEFVEGLEVLGCETIDDIKTEIASWEESLNSTKKLSEFIKYTFDFITNSKIITPKNAITLWNSIYSQRNLPFFKPFINYYETKSMEPITKDTWIGVHHFLIDVKTVEDYDADEGMYPSLIDLFMNQYTSS